MSGEVRTLQDLVPQLELCKEIPDGHFEDSAMVWALSCSDKPFVQQRYIIKMALWGKIVAPAPTMAEIMAELDMISDDVSMWNNSAKHWWNIQGENMTTGETHGKREKNPATAALKLWLELKGIEA